MIEVHVKEEIYYREALKRGLDRNDTVIRRRMRQKMEFLTEPSDEVLKASDAELEAYLAANRSEFRVEPRVAFQQIFINPKKSEEPPAARAQKLKAKLNTAGFQDSPVARLDSLGDPTLLPRALPKMPLAMIDRRFGRGFGKQLAKLSLNQWHGPIRSPFGLHLVRVTERREGYDPPLVDVRAAVERRWRAAKREAYKQAEYRRLREKYEVVLPNLGDRKQKAKKAP
jgi:hypothetical protein